jgi:hypothetical protein
MTDPTNSATAADEAYEAAYGPLANLAGPATVLRLALADPDRIAGELSEEVAAATRPTSHAVWIAEGNAGRSAAIIARLPTLSASMLIYRSLADLARLGARASELGVPSRWLFNVDGAGLAWPDRWHPAVSAGFCFAERTFSAEIERVHQKWFHVFEAGPTAEWVYLSDAAVEDLPLMVETERRLTALILVRLLATGETVMSRAHLGESRLRWRTVRRDDFQELPRSWRGPLAG